MRTLLSFMRHADGAWLRGDPVTTTPAAVHALEGLGMVDVEVHDGELAAAWLTPAGLAEAALLP
jgi:hypothetical protein